MWKRLTEKARQVVFWAQEEAQGRGQRQVGPEHFLLAVVRHDDSVAARLLTQLGVCCEKVRCRIDERAARDVWRGDEHQDTCLTAAGKRLVDLAYEEARRLDTNYIGTEHFLLALAAGGGDPQAVLTALGADLDRVRSAVDNLPRDPSP